MQMSQPVAGRIVETFTRATAPHRQPLFCGRVKIASAAVRGKDAADFLCPLLLSRARTTNCGLAIR